MYKMQPVGSQWKNENLLEWFKGGRRDLDIVAPGQDVKPNPRLPLDFPLSHQDMNNQENEPTCCFLSCRIFNKPIYQFILSMALIKIQQCLTSQAVVLA
jgi:hypothetical protein